MLVNLFLILVVTFVGGLVGLFPAYSLPAEVTSLGSKLGEAVATANGIFPVVTLGICLGLVLGLVLFLAAWDAVVWVYEKIPFKAT